MNCSLEVFYYNWELAVQEGIDRRSLSSLRGPSVALAGLVFETFHGDVCVPVNSVVTPVYNTYRQCN